MPSDEYIERARQALEKARQHRDQAQLSSAINKEHAESASILVQILIERQKEKLDKGKFET